MRHSRQSIPGLGAVALAAALAGCNGLAATPAAPSSAPPATAGLAGPWQDADLVVVVSGHDVDALVGIDVEHRAVTAPTPIDRNQAKPHMDGGMVEFPPVSVVLMDPALPHPLLWTVASGEETVRVRELDRTQGEVRPIPGPDKGVLPFLYDGQLAWASGPRNGRPRVLLGNGTELDVTRVPTFVVAGPGPGRISAVVELGNIEIGERNERIVVIDVATNTTTFLPTDRLHYGGLWADGSTLAASSYARIVPTPEDPQNGEPDNRVLTWHVDQASSPDAVAGLVEEEALRTNLYPELVAGSNELLAVITSNFNEPRVEVHPLRGNEPARVFQLPEASFVTAMRFVGTTLVVLSSRHVTFIDLTTEEMETIAFDGATQTMWVGP